MVALAVRPLENGAEMSLFADDWTTIRKPLADIFRAACEKEAAQWGGWVNPNFVRARVLADFKAGLVDCDEPEMNHRQYSALWGKACSRDGYLDKTDVPVAIDGTHSRGNGNKDVLYRRWRT